MNRMYVLKYNRITDLVSKEKIIAMSNIELQKYLIQMFLERDFDIRLNYSIAITNDTDKLKIFLTNSATPILVGSISLYGGFLLTETGSQLLGSDENIQFILFETIGAVLASLKLDDSYKNKELKVVKGKYYYKLIDKKNTKESLLYKDSSDDNLSYKIIDNNNKIDIISNDFLKKVYTIPSNLYPLPNNSDIKVFTSENTKEIERTDISEILSDDIYKIGFCYTNADLIANKLVRAGLNIKVEFYSGWLLSYNKMVHHAWVVLDDIHIIDTAFFRDDNSLKQFYDNNRLGKAFYLNKQQIADNTIKLMNSKESFHKKYMYGRILDNNNIYIGVKSNSIEARKSFIDLLNKNPNHPDYLNMNKETGSNETLDLIYK